MKTNMRKKVAVAALILILGLINWAIINKQRLIAEGKVVLLPLASADPRSLMQGDYMALDYAIGQEIYAELSNSDDTTGRHHDVSDGDGFVVVRLDENKVASYVRLDDEQTLMADEIRLFYRVRNGEVKFASNAFFFEEGQAGDYWDAVYGEFRVAENSELLLVALRDKQFQLLGQH